MLLDSQVGPRHRVEVLDGARRPVAVRQLGHHRTDGLLQALGLSTRDLEHGTRGSRQLLSTCSVIPERRALGHREAGLVGTKHRLDDLFASGLARNALQSLRQAIEVPAPPLCAVLDVRGDLACPPRSGPVPASLTTRFGCSPRPSRSLPSAFAQVSPERSEWTSAMNRYCGSRSMPARTGCPLAEHLVQRDVVDARQVDPLQQGRRALLRLVERAPDLSVAPARAIERGQHLDDVTDRGGRDRPQRHRRPLQMRWRHV